MTYRAPVPLESTHTTDGFRCASGEQTTWLQRYARQANASGTSAVFVVTEAGDDQVVAYYAWCMAQLALDDAPPRMRKGAGRYPQPVALLTRLGVDERHGGRGLGAGLLRDALTRLVALREDIGCRGLLVHCESDEARAFYRQLVPEFEPSPTDPLHLVLLLKDLRRTLGL